MVTDVFFITVKNTDNVTISYKTAYCFVRDPIEYSLLMAY